MFRKVSTLLATAFFATVTFAAVPSGSPAPAFSGTDALSGKPVRLDALKGKVVVLEWNNFECPFVHKFYDSGTMQKLQKTATADGVVWVTINSNAEGKEGYLADDATAKAAVAEHHGSETYFLRDPSGTIGHAYGAKSTPTMFVIDKSGMLVYQGAIDSIPTPDVNDIPKATNYVTEALKSVKAGTPVKTSQTQSYGCFVKY
jgi:peroxiredoxin